MACELHSSECNGTERNDLNLKIGLAPDLRQRGKSGRHSSTHDTVGFSLFSIASDYLLLSPIFSVLSAVLNMYSGIMVVVKKIGIVDYRATSISTFRTTVLCSNGSKRMNCHQFPYLK